MLNSLCDRFFGGSGFDGPWKNDLWSFESDAGLWTWVMQQFARIAFIHFESVLPILGVVADCSICCLPSQVAGSYAEDDLAYWHYGTRGVEAPGNNPTSRFGP